MNLPRPVTFAIVLCEMTTLVIYLLLDGTTGGAQ